MNCIKRHLIFMHYSLFGPPKNLSHWKFEVFVCFFCSCSLLKAPLDSNVLFGNIPKLTYYNRMSICSFLRVLRIGIRAVGPGGSKLWPFAVLWHGSDQREVGGGFRGYFEAKSLTCYIHRRGARRLFNFNFVLETASKSALNLLGGRDREGSHNNPCNA